MKQSVLESHVEEVALQVQRIPQSRYSIWVLAAISFLESALPVPLITDPFLVAFILANTRKTMYAVIVTTVASVAGGLFAYAVAFTFYEVIVAQYLTGSLGSQFADIVARSQDGVFLVTLAGAVTPVPYTLVALGAGFLKANVLLFVFASVLGRGGRYLLVGYLTHRFGRRAFSLMRQNVVAVTILFVLGVLVYLLLR